MNINIITGTGAVAVALAAFIGCGAPVVDEAPPRREVSEDPSDNPLQDLSPALQKLFDDGDAAFEARFFPAQGLGPLYIRNSCAACHADDGKGPGFVTKMVVLDDEGRPVDGALPFGGTVRPFFEPPATQPLRAPDVDGLVTSSRTGPAVFGRGFVEAVADAEIERVEAAQAARGDGISGRVHRVAYNSKSNPDTTFHSHAEGQTGLIGRFGLKARIATVDEFAADAYQGDMGITSPLRPVELPNPDGVADDVKAGLDVDADTVNAVAGYMRLLDIPDRAVSDDDAGAALFDAVDCAVCHVPSLRTSASYPIAAIADVDAALYSDLLLHDMGDGLADGVVDGDASGREWKTPPLMGLRFFRGFLHDSRAGSVEEAIEAHASDGSEANGSVEKFNRLSDDERAALVTWVKGL